MQVRATLSSRPQPSHAQHRGRINEPLARCIEACFEGAQASMSCAEASLAEPSVAHLARCIRLSLDCADACAATGQMLTRRTPANTALLRRMVETCAELCRACADECDRQAVVHEHCRTCAEACLACERACREAALTLDTAGA
jgi:hypothetical protein